MNRYGSKESQIVGSENHLHTTCRISPNDSDPED